MDALLLSLMSPIAPAHNYRYLSLSVEKKSVDETPNVEVLENRASWASGGGIDCEKYEAIHLAA